MRKSKKPVKSVESPKPKQVDEDSWRKPLETIAINDDEWWCMVIMMVETITDHSRCVSFFNIAAEEGRRKAIYPLTYQKTLASVKALSKQSLDKSPTIQGVCRYANKILEAENETLPTWLMARVIKYLIYRAREENIGIVKRLINLEREIDEEYWIMQTVEDWGPHSKKFSLDHFEKKANTKLRKRNEEWRDAVYIDDAPINGPNLYIILMGFHDPDLLGQLKSIGVPICCMLQIKRPNEELNRNIEEEIVDIDESKKLVFFEKYTVTKSKLYNFWTTVEKRLQEAELYPEYHDIGFLIFCPPRYSKTLDKKEYEANKKDIYNRVSYILYDFYDLYRQHGNYLKSMKIETSIFDKRIEKPNMKVYKSFMDTFNTFLPECVLLPLIMIAMLMQVEETEKKMKQNIMEKTSDTSGISDIKIKEEYTEKEVTVEITREYLISYIEEKLKTLNLKYGLDEENNKDQIDYTVTDIDLILHGNKILEAIVDISAIPFLSKPSDLIDNIISILRHPVITKVHEKNKITEKKLNNYFRHIDNLRYCFDLSINTEKIKHYLHILMFDRMLFDSKVKTNKSKILERMKKEDDPIYIQDSTVTIKRCKSLPSLYSESMYKVYFLSDGNIDYGKVFPQIVECSPLFDLVDPRELLVPGYLEENVFATRPTNNYRLEDFNDVELLPEVIFLQLVYECLLAFDHIEFRYFEPTDSLLLHFHNKWRINDVSEEERISSIRTPLRFGDFCKYVVPEEQQWLRKEEEQNRLQTTREMERLMTKSAKIYDETMSFRDEDFILPGTLKAKYEIYDLNKQKTNRDLVSYSSTTKSGKKDLKKEKKKTDKLSSRRSLKSTDNEWISIQDSEKEKHYDFVGYALSELRVQVSNQKKTFFSADDTLVQVNLEDWLYKSKRLYITVTVNGYTLRLSRRIDIQENIEILHLTSRLGIVVTFQMSLNFPDMTNNPDSDWQDSKIEYRISSPAGLFIEPISADGPENPYYIKQSYLRKGYIDYKNNREICRKFLRNGTILKCLDDGTIIIFRSNGVIVTCTSFEKINNQNEQDQTNGKNGTDIKSKEPKNPKEKIKKKSKFRSTEEESEEKTTESEAQMTSKSVKVSRYTVLNHDGEQYEVHNDLVVSDHHRLLVRMVSDYEVDEKFTRRADGTNMLLNSNGELIVRFPDNTCITTSYIVEEEPVTCEWTEEEIQQYASSGKESKEEKKEDDEDMNSMVLIKRHIDYKKRINELLTDNTFVSVLLKCRMEHKNYATVCYDQSALSCTLSMPDDLQIRISREGHYEVSMADGVNLNVTEDKVLFKGNMCNICGNQSTSTYYFFPFMVSDILFSTIDVFGNIFEVKSDGNTSHYRNFEILKYQKQCADNLSEGEESYEERFEEGMLESFCNHETLNFKANGLKYRIFAMNRDFTGYEYIHRLVRNQIELMAMIDKDTSIISYPNPYHSALHRLVMFYPVYPTKITLEFPDFHLKQRNFDRREILRSTYSIPYDWLFPFGRNDNGIWKNTHDLPLMDHTKAPPKLLYIRILRGFKEPSGNAVIDIQRALGRYWMSLIHNSDFHPSLIMDQVPTFSKMKPVYNYLEENLRELSLGNKKKINVEIYELGLEREWISAKPKIKRKSIKYEEILKYKIMKREELKWYKRCMREKFILPYFENITGTCFLWIKDCMEYALHN